MSCMLCENVAIEIVYTACQESHQVCEECTEICPVTNKVKCFFCEYNCDNCDTCKKYGTN